MCLRYGVKIKWLHNGEIETLHQQITMHCTQMHNEKAVWKINKQQFLINEEESENPIYELSIACAEQLYTIQLLVNKLGQLDNILHIEDIQQRFAVAKPTLLRDFDGSITEQYINQIEETICNQKYLLNQLTTDIWLSLFFVPIYTQYDSETFKANIQVPFPFYNFEQPVMFTTETTIDFNLADTETYTLNCQGKLDTNQLPAMVGHKYHPTDGNINLVYDLDRHKHHIQNINAEITIQNGQETNQIIVKGYTLNNEEKVEPIKNNKKEKNPYSLSSLFFGD